MGIADRFSDLFASWRRILILVKKPDEDEFKLSLKLTFLGFALIGAIAYIIHLIAAWITLTTG